MNKLFVLPSTVVFPSLLSSSTYSLIIMDGIILGCFFVSFGDVTNVLFFGLCVPIDALLTSVFLFPVGLQPLNLFLGWSVLFPIDFLVLPKSSDFLSFPTLLVFLANVDAADEFNDNGGDDDLTDDRLIAELLAFFIGTDEAV